MRSRTRLSSTCRGLLGVLCMLLCITSKVEAKTNEELKEYAGLSNKQQSSEDNQEENIEYRLDIEENDKEQLEKEKEKEKQEIEKLKDEFDKKKVEVGVMLRSGKSPYSIIELIGELKEIENNISKTNIDELEINGSIDETKVTLYKSSTDINSKWYDIGNIGNTLSPCVDNLVIKIPYGYEVEYDYESNKYIKLGEKHTGLTLSCKAGDKVYSQFNGKVYTIEKDSNNKNITNICIYHGDNTYTIYKGLNSNTNIHKGDIVSQYQEIGETLNNELEFEVIIDNKKINPILLYGNSGKNYYTDFITKSEKKYVVGNKEKYYIDNE